MIVAQEMLPTRPRRLTHPQPLQVLVFQHSIHLDLVDLRLLPLPPQRGVDQPPVRRQQYQARRRFVEAADGVHAVPRPVAVPRDLGDDVARDPRVRRARDSRWLEILDVLERRRAEVIRCNCADREAPGVTLCFRLLSTRNKIRSSHRRGRRRRRR